MKKNKSKIGTLAAKIKMKKCMIMKILVKVKNKRTI